MSEEGHFEALSPELASDETALIVDVEGFEGPLDLLLMPARQQKVDLSKISILALADQYLAFIEEARLIRLELAADYLVMAAWLAYLKSRLLLPENDSELGPSAEDMATALALRLRRLEAIRHAAEAREALERMIGATTDWSRLDHYLLSYVVEPAMRATVMASSFASVLEMVREGALDVHQDTAFGPIFLRKHSEEGAAPPAAVQ